MKSKGSDKLHAINGHTEISPESMLSQTMLTKQSLMGTDSALTH